MDWQKKAINLLTVCRKAGKLVLGFDPVKEAVLGGKAECVLVTADISPKTLKETGYYCSRSSIKIIQLDCSMNELEVLFRKKTVVMAVIDKGFAERFIELSISTENSLPKL